MKSYSNLSNKAKGDMVMLRTGSTQVIEQTLQQTLQKYWDSKLSGDRALAPRDLHDSLSQSEYDEGNRDFGRFSSLYIKTELELMDSLHGRDSLADGYVSIAGIGLGREIGFVKTAMQMGMKINIHDVSEKALSMVEKKIAKFSPGIRSRVTTYHEEIDGSEGQIVHDSKLIIMSQFLQILEPGVMLAVMRSLAVNFQQCEECRLIIIHPFHNEENVGWGDTNPYSLDELLDPLNKELNGEMVGVVRQGPTEQHEYFRYFGYHNYKALTIAKL